MSIQILMQRLWVGEVACERIEAIEGAAGRVVEPGTQVLLAAVARPFATVQVARNGAGGRGQAGAAEHVAVGIVGVLLGDGARRAQQRPGAAVTTYKGP